jgi:hypothetical protein
MFPIHRASRLAALSLLIAVIAGCAGTTAATSAPGGTTPSGPGGGATQSAGGPASTPAPSTGGGGTPVDACSFLTADDIKAVTGYAISTTRATASDMVFPSGCEWELTAKEIVPPSIVLGIQTSGGKAYYESYFKPFKDQEGNTPIDGLGDEAIDVGFGAVVVLKGDTLFNLQYLGVDDHEVELAKKLVAHL